MYTPKNNWSYQGQVNTCFTSIQFEQLEEEFEFSGETINIDKFSCNMFGNLVFDFTFKGVKFEGIRKLDSVKQALWNTKEWEFDVREYIEFEMALELFSPDNMNDVYYNHELYL